MRGYFQCSLCMSTIEVVYGESDSFGVKIDDVRKEHYKDKHPEFDENKKELVGRSYNGLS